MLIQKECSKLKNNSESNHYGAEMSNGVQLNC